MVERRVPAGWHDDPMVAGGKRWWDGEQWTMHTQPAPPTTPPPPAAPPPPAQPPAPIPAQTTPNYLQANQSQADSVSNGSYVDRTEAAAPPRKIWPAFLIGGGLLVLLAGLAQVISSDDDLPSRQTAEEATAPAAAGAEPELMIVTDILGSPDESGFLNGVQLREPEAADTLGRATLVDFGLRSCRIRNGYIMGSRPSPTETLAANIAGEVGTLDPDDVASAVANAAQDRLCDVSVIEAP